MMKRIIFVDDDPGIADTVKLLLERAGYDVTVFAKGMALMNNHYQLPDLYILDKRLPDIDGLDICLRLKNEENTKDIPVIMLSADPDIKRLAQSVGANDAIEKPFTLQTLRAVVKQHISL